jgi:protein phosphatase 2C family protein 2/3
VEKLRAGADDFLLIACDGLWDVLSSKQTVDFIKFSADYPSDPQAVCKELVNHAIRNKHTQDNVTAMLVNFGS